MSRNQTTDWKAASLCQIVLVSVLFCGAGCTSLGPRTVRPDRIDYNNAVSESWKQQTLLNIVRLRYGDAPVFIKVAQIIGGYTMEQRGNLGWGIDELESLRWINSFSIGAEAKYTDRPTITYMPMTGSKFIRNMMTPIPAEVVLFMIQAGWPADAVMQYTVQAVNGLQNRLNTHDKRTPGNPDFFKLISLLRDVQASGTLGLRVEKQEKGPDAIVWFFSDQRMSPGVIEKTRQIRKILGLRAEAKKFRVTFGGVAKDDLNISIKTRSMFHLLIDLSSFVNVPPKHIKDGQTEESLPIAPGARPLITIYSGRWKSDNTFAAVQYNGYWYWVNKCDRPSKRALSFMV
ncbi:MAG: hypothetical protein K8S55_01930, partial [Phycisphaerae bacterium]|nr:hypothetical protein [Phycisphaerae bacterium]